MKTNHIKIKKGQRAEVHIRNPRTPTCDGKSTRGYFNVVVVGPCSISVVIREVRRVLKGLR